MIFQIPNDKYHTDLLCFLHPNRFDTDEDKNLVSLLHKICCAGLTDFRKNDLIENLRLTTEEKEIALQNKWEESNNIEIRARCLDVLRHYEKDKRKITQESSDAYMEVYRSTKEVEYLIRAVSVRNIKVLNDDKFFRVVTSYVQELYPYWINHLITALSKSYTTTQLSFLVSLIENKRQQFANNKEFHSERECIRIYCCPIKVKWMLIIESILLIING